MYARIIGILANFFVEEREHLKEGAISFHYNKGIIKSMYLNMCMHVCCNVKVVIYIWETFALVTLSAISCVKRMNCQELA